MNLARVLAHELAHALYQNGYEDLKVGYRKATGWVLTLEGRTVYQTRRKSGYVAADGATSAKEDFANNVEYFLFDRKALKTATESADGWLQSTFGDRLKLKGSVK